ncbi:hypothetical protein D3C72_1882290 [compost metagenome]
MSGLNSSTDSRMKILSEVRRAIQEILMMDNFQIFSNRCLVTAPGAEEEITFVDKISMLNWS